MRFAKIVLVGLIVLPLLFSCAKKANNESQLGTKDHPIRMFFVPSMEAAKVVTSGEGIAKLLHDKTGLEFKVAVPTSYSAVIAALQTNEADVAWLATFAYVLANKVCGAEVGLMTVRNGLKEYRGQFVARTDRPMKRLEDIAGKTIAYTDAASTSGYVYPSALLKQRGITPGKEMMTGSHPAAIMAVYEGKADVGCSFWSPANDKGEPQDARKALLETKPDVMTVVQPFAYTDWIPNDTVTFRSNMSPELRAKITQALIDIAASPDGKALLKTLYDIDGLAPATDADYNVVRKVLETLGISVGDLVK
jgi:phosphonate transport system substrate-binding protein